MRWFWETEELNESGCADFKAEACPHCGRHGTLNRHGWLFGSEATGDGKQARRGRRLYCSRRGQRPGCGRTVSLMSAQVLRRMRTRTGPLWQYLRRVLLGESVARAWVGLERVFSLESAYRYRRQLGYGQCRLREILCRERAPPCAAAGSMAAMLAHLEAVVGPADDLIGRFQWHFQEQWPR